MELEIYDELQSAQLAMRGGVEQVKVKWLVATALLVIGSIAALILRIQ